MGNDYRPGAFAPSSELSGGIAQVQATLQATIERVGQHVELTDKHGNPTGETLFNYDPRSFLVIGSLGQFATRNGLTEAKFRSFELFRRNIRRPEIITFDEFFIAPDLLSSTRMAAYRHNQRRRMAVISLFDREPNASTITHRPICGSEPKNRT